ncbi:MAG: prolipoprotein diacylglyceryl transferase [Deltaproteobacteria bacterium]|nr:prolipoprotein diacylglyceryl transferase [Deltaproteobacteria bacterium]
MNEWIFYHHISPYIASFGSFHLGWYGMMYFISFMIFYAILAKQARQKGAFLNEVEVSDLVTYVVAGTIVGGRMGYILFYGQGSYLENPLRIFMIWQGGMSFHGGLAGVTVALWAFARRNQKDLLNLGDYVVTWTPIGLFFGRIGNFINAELYGKPTDGTWGVVFPTDPERLPRHPSQLYQSFMEGLVLLSVLMLLRKYFPHRRGLQPAAALTGFATFRIVVEFVRLPDAHMGYYWGWATMGQILSVPMLLLGLGWIVYIFRQHPAEPEK